MEKPAAKIIGGAGTFVSWNGGALLIGRKVGCVPVHSHYAIQIAFGSEPGLKFRPSDDDEWRAYGGAIIPSRQPHSMDATGLPVNAVMFVEPETSEGRILDERYLAAGIADMPDASLAATRAVFEAFQAGDRAALATACVGVIRALTGEVAPRVESDERILRAIAYINANLDGKLTLQEVAGQAFLSPSRFRHLFVEQTGLQLRPYILWRRFLKVWELVVAGESMSGAAHAAGFADAAHLSRTSKKMFGFPPALMRAGLIAGNEDLK
jgi:AraC family transcriptional regulator